MKSKTTFLVSIIALAAIIFALSQFVSYAYSNEPPGPQGQRRTQVVQCQVSGWDTAVGCCFGGEECDYMDPCDGKNYTCGKGWIAPETSRDDDLHT